MSIPSPVYAHSTQDFERMDRTIEQLRERMESNFDAINGLLREMVGKLATLNSTYPLQQKTLEDIKIHLKDIESRVLALEKKYAETKGMTTTAKLVWGGVVAASGAAITELVKIFK